MQHAWLPLVKLLLIYCFALEAGDIMPASSLKLLNVNHQSLSLNDIRGTKGTVVIFGSNTCQHISASDARIKNLGSTYQAKGISAVMINPNDPNVVPAESLEKMKEKTYPFPYLADPAGEMAKAFGATNTTEAFLFDAKGHLVYHGAFDDNPKDQSQVKKRWLRDAIESLLAGEKINVSKTEVHGRAFVLRETKK
jgi:peroxiredoxin